MDAVAPGVALVLIAASFAIARWRRLSLALATAFANLGVFGAAAVAWSLFGNPAFLFDLTLVHEPGALTGWEPVALLTSMYAHANLAHLLYNVLALLLIGMLLEERIGAAAFGRAYLATGLLAGLAFLLLYFDTRFVLLGASGAVSGLFGVLARLYPRQRLALWAGFVVLPPIPVYLLFALNLVAQTLLALFAVGSIAYAAHVIGAAAGFALAPLLVPRPSLPGPGVAVDHLTPLATTAELRGILEAIRGETLPEVREAWFARFRERARCPRCGGPLTWRGGVARSACGWRLRP